jgi:hypothetical protein
VSKFAMLLLGALLGALVLSSTAGAASKYCSVLSGREIGRPLGLHSLRVSSVSLAYPAQAGGRGKITLCSYKAAGDTVAETSVAKFTNAAGARREFASIIHREQRAGQAKKTKGPWTDAYDVGSDGFIALDGRWMFHIQYASGAQGYSNATPKVLARLAARAVRKL